MRAARAGSRSFPLQVTPYFQSSLSHDFCLVCIESEGFYPPERLLPEAVQVMRTKIATLRRAAEALLDDTGTNEDTEMAEA